LLEAVQADLKTRTERTAHLEATAERLHQENRGVSERLSRVTQMSRELEDIHRRRETYLTSILRRYRELTEQYRVLVGRAERPGESAVPAGTELARIQSALGGAEEDLRQLTALNAQAARLQRKIGSQ
jgi:chromosome segregation ATPase